MIEAPAIEAIRYRDPALSFDERADDHLGRLAAGEAVHLTLRGPVRLDRFEL